jgi:hypothetical protein
MDRWKFRLIYGLTDKTARAEWPGQPAFAVTHGKRVTYGKSVTYGEPSTHGKPVTEGESVTHWLKDNTPSFTKPMTDTLLATPDNYSLSTSFAPFFVCSVA